MTLMIVTTILSYYFSGTELFEFPYYYTRLLKMEKAAKKTLLNEVKIHLQYQVASDYLKPQLNSYQV